MKVYVAAKFGEIARGRDVAGKLSEIGCEITSGWLTREPGCLLNDEAIDNIRDVKASDAVVLMTGLGEQAGGKDVEFGLGIAWNKMLFVVGERRNVFHHLDFVRQFESDDELIEAFAKLI